MSDTPDQGREMQDIANQINATANDNLAVLDTGSGIELLEIESIKN